MKKIANQIDINAVKLIKSGAFKGYTPNDIVEMRKIKRAYLQKNLFESLKRTGVKITKEAFAEILNNADAAIPGVMMTLPTAKFASVCDETLIQAIKERMSKKAEDLNTVPAENPIADYQGYAQQQDAQAILELLAAAGSDGNGAPLNDESIAPAGNTMMEVAQGFDLGTIMPEQNTESVLGTENGMTNVASLADLAFLDTMNKISSLVDLLRKQAEEGEVIVPSVAADAANKKMEEEKGNDTESSVKAPAGEVKATGVAANTVGMNDPYTASNDKPAAPTDAMVGGLDAKTSKLAQSNLDAVVNRFLDQMKMKK